MAAELPAGTAGVAGATDGGRALGPVRERERITALDAARGVALVGILLVNINTFGEAFGYFVSQQPRDDRGDFEQICWVLGKALWEGRFYPLFSMLFGMGLVIQERRAAAAGRAFAPTALRRLIVLAIVGAAHALLLWYGDILFVYGMVGLLMIPLVRASARTLCTIAVTVMLASVLLTTALGLLSAAFDPAHAPKRDAVAAVAEGAPTADSGGTPDSGRVPDPAPAADPAPVNEVSPDAPPASDAVESAPDASAAGSTPFRTWLREIGERGMSSGPTDPRWIELETMAYRDGPWFDAFGFRAVTWGMFLIIGFFIFGASVFSMFCLGAALMKWSFFDASRGHWHTAIVLVAALVMVPVSFAAALTTVQAGDPATAAIATGVQFLAGPFVALGYLSAVTLVVRHRLLPRAVAVLCAAGRMAFTNYLLQTLVATAIFHHWGLGRFDSMTRLERIGTALAIIAGQFAFSVLWLRLFTMGPLEWLWRLATYLRPTPLLRRD